MKLQRVLIGVILCGLILSGWILPAGVAQEDIVDPVALIQQGYIVTGSVGNIESVYHLLPITCETAIECDMAWLMFPRLIGVDPKTSYYGRGNDVPDNYLTLDWEISEDARTYTFYLREDRFWSDGEAIDAEDVVFSLEMYSYDGLEDIEAVDPYTVRVTFEDSDCTAFSSLDIGIIPSHAPETPDVFNSEFSHQPTVTSGFFTFDRYADNALLLKASDAFVDMGETGNVQGFALVSVENQDVMTDMFLKGQLNYLEAVPPERLADVRDADSVQTYEYTGQSWDYLALNLADPTAPADGYKGNAHILQGNHPLFGDVRVRRAIQMAINVPGIIETAVNGEATQMASYSLPVSWAHDNSLTPLPYDPEAAVQLLEEVGWEMGDNGVLVARNTLYTEPGTEFRFTLQTNRGNTRREKTAAMIAEQLAEIGIEVTVELREFNELIDIMNAQTFDAYILGWRDSFPVIPIPYIFLGINDIVGYGTNTVSYYNPDFEALYGELRTLPGCDTGQREIYQKMQMMAQNDQPYIWLFAPNAMVAARKNIEDFSPYPRMPLWNVDSWVINP